MFEADHSAPISNIRLQNSATDAQGVDQPQVGRRGPTEVEIVSAQKLDQDQASERSSMLVGTTFLLQIGLQQLVVCIRKFRLLNINFGF